MNCCRIVVLGLCCASFLAAQPADDTTLKQVIIFGRHGVRSPVVDNGALNNFSAQPFPVFSVPGVSNLTTNGAVNETILGGYFRLWLTQEGILTGKDPADASSVYFRANNGQLIIDTAKAFWAGFLPGATANVNFYPPPQQNDPLFFPVNAGVAQLDEQMAVAAVQGRLGDSAQSLTTAYGPELALTRSILFHYPAGQTPAPAAPAGKIDVTTLPIAITGSSSPVDMGGLGTVVIAIDPFAMEYADGMPDADIGWGQLTADGISQITRLYNLAIDLDYRTPYLAGVQSSNLASHIVRSLVQSSTGNAMSGAVANPSTKVIMLMAANTNIAGLAGLFHLDWVVPGYPPDTCAPGGALVFELRQSQSTGEYFVRTSYITQTMDQLRNKAPLTLSSPPAIAPVFIPGCSTHNATFDCTLSKFVKVANHVIDQRSVDLTN